MSSTRPTSIDRCGRAGLSLEGIGAAIADGRLSLALLDLVSVAGRPLTETTYAQLCGAHPGRPGVWGEPAPDRQAEPGFYHDYVEEPLLASGMDEQQMREAASQMSDRLAEVVQRMLVALYTRLRERYTIDCDDPERGGRGEV